MSSGATRARFRHPDFHGRLRRVIGTAPPFAWAKQVGISKGAFTRIWKQGTIPTAELLYRIRRMTGVSLDWLLTGEGEPGGSAAPATAGDALVPLPALAESPGEPGPGGFLALRREWAARRFGTEPDALAVVWIRGDAMAPTLEDGDLATIDRRQRRIAQDGLYALRQEGTVRILRVQRLSGGRFQASGDNPRYKPFIFTARRSGVSVAGRVVCASRFV